MRVAFDTETHLIQPGRLIPRLVCGSFFWANAGPDDVRLATREDALDHIEHILTQTDAHIVIQNAAFDMAVVANERPHLLSAVFRAYNEGRIRCTKVRERLIAIARGELKDDDHPGKRTSFSLDAIVLRRFNVDISKDKHDPGSWRLRYADLDGVPLGDWPAEAVRYAQDDAEWHMKVFEDQAREFSPGDLEAYMPNEREQTRRSFSLHLASAWGLRTDPVAVEALAERIEAATVDAHRVLQMSAEDAYAEMQAPAPRFHRVLYGEDGKGGAFEDTDVDWEVPTGLCGEPLIRLKSTKKKATGAIEVEEVGNTKVKQALVERDFEARGLRAPRTAPSSKFPQGQTKTDGETLETTRDPRLLLAAAIAGFDKVKSVWLDALRDGTTKPLNPRWENPLATGRTSCSNPPVQQPPRKGGVRECFVPRPGFWFLATDYSFIELVTWAQACLDLFGYSDMADLVRAGKDPHSVMAVEILLAEGGHDGLTYEVFRAALKAGEAWAKDARQLAKAANFGYPGGLQAQTFIDYAWGNYGVRLDIHKATLVRNAWLRTYREAQPYLDHHKALAPAWGDTFTVVQSVSGRVRGGCTFTSGCNTRFQGRAADGAEEAEWRIVQECYLGPGPLYGCRYVLFLHDEFILEVPADPDLAHAANLQLQKHMVDGMRKFCPDVPCKAEPTLMERWYKQAEPVYDDQGRLTVWRPT